MTAASDCAPYRRRLNDERRWTVKAITGLLFAAFAILVLLPVPAKAWWNDEWQLRKKITLDTSAAGANVTEQIGTTPVLVRLHAGNFRFASAKDDGSDLRFIAADDKTPLKHHNEKYDSLLSEALVWVAVPNVKPGSKTEIWVYYGNKKAVSTGDAKGTYDPESLLVYHFSERGTPALDSSVWANNAQSVGRPAEDSLIGIGVRLDGNTPVTLPASPSLALAANGTLTWSAWIKPAVLQPNAVLYSRRSGADGLVIGLDNGVPFVEITNAGAAQRSAGAAPIAANSWHHVALVANGGQITLYLDGNSYSTLAAALPALNSVALIGGDTPAANPAQIAPVTPSPAADANPSAVPPPAAETPADASNPTPASAAAPEAAPVPIVSAMAGFVGDIDELEIAKTARPAGFIKFAAIEQGTDPAKLISFSIDEETASWLSGYEAVILKSVTIDGWVVIGVLLILAVLSWVVMVDKATFLNKQTKANGRFIRRFRELTADLTTLDRGDGTGTPALGAIGDAEDKIIATSSLYRIYHIGAAEIGRRFARNDGQPTVLSAVSIAAIRAALDGGVVKEMQRLNRLMVVLTIAISGGPFLGLLGTVIGVMITFAAIAASGDVNVNAIAPGIAAALVATVAGLGVAIPALFGYNYLISRIKNLTDDIQVFVDEFVTKMAEFYSADRPGPVAQRMAAE
jgi:biopolymer transport protein ExbB